MKVLLIQSGKGVESFDESARNTDMDAVVNPPLGLCYISSVLQQHNHEVFGIDLFLIDSFSDLSKALDRKPDLIGISFTTEKYEDTRKVVEFCRAKTKVPIIAGGPHVSFRPDEAIRDLKLDGIVKFDGEYVMVDICKALEDNKPLNSVPGFYINESEYRPGRVPNNIDDLPIPDRDTFNFYKYRRLQKKRMGKDAFNIVGTRGCPFNCIFCVANAVRKHQKVRRRSMKSILKEIEYMKNKYGMDNFVLCDELFVQDIEDVKEFCNQLKKIGKFEWFCEGRVNILTKELIAEMAQAGCSHIQVGIESATNSVLKSIKKGISVEQTMNVVKWCKEYGVYLHGIVIIGLPTDTKETLQNNLELMEYMGKYDTDLLYSILTPFPGTELGENPEKYGLTILSQDYEQYRFDTCNIETENLKKDDIYEAINTISKKKRRIERERILRSI